MGLDGGALAAAVLRALADRYGFGSGQLRRLGGGADFDARAFRFDHARATDGAPALFVKLSLAPPDDLGPRLARHLANAGIPTERCWWTWTWTWT